MTHANRSENECATDECVNHSTDLHPVRLK